MYSLVHEVTISQLTDEPPIEPPGYTRKRLALNFAAAWIPAASVAAQDYDRTCLQSHMEGYLIEVADPVTGHGARQLVFGVFMLNWYAGPACTDNPDREHPCRPPTGLLSAEVIDVAGGVIHHAEVVCTYTEYAAPTGWD